MGTNWEADLPIGTPGTIIGNNYSEHGFISGKGRDGEPWFTTDSGMAWSGFDVSFRPDDKSKPECVAI